MNCLVIREYNFHVVNEKNICMLFTIKGACVLNIQGLVLRESYILTV